MTASETDGSSIGSRNWKLAIFGVAHVLVGIGFFYGLVTDSITLLTAVLVGVLGFVLLSLAIVVRREGLITPENKLIGGFVLVAIVLLFGLETITDLPSEVVFGIVFVVGVVLPHLVLEYTDYGQLV
ncbi:hypothetical protein [Halopiger goleimassiliensis]|uniref:hypothetical protein n=1 Tax=Halopiger goleimassiliensis TaxID=1293048 RepID=UPI00067830B3|nr:hypothetical protein [Halopiger goleimassiliensis]